MKHFAAITLGAFLLMTIPLQAAEGSDSEELRYRWKLSGFKGIVARLFIPGTGEGTLTTGPAGSGGAISELRISSPASRRGDFWLYGSEFDPDMRRTVKAWSSQQFRGKARERAETLERDDVVDLASSIYFLRRELPDKPLETNIWSSGKIYRVAVRPSGRAARLVDGAPLRTRSYTLRGVGEPLWRGRLDLVLAEDETSTPLEIAVSRDGMRVHLELVE